MFIGKRFYKFIFIGIIFFVWINASYATKQFPSNTRVTRYDLAILQTVDAKTGYELKKAN